MAKRKKKAEEGEAVVADFKFFKQEIEEDGVRVMSAGDIEDPEPNCCGSYNLDYDLVIPFPEGRITEVFGAEGTCKTTLILEILGQALSRGKICLYVNMEKNLNLSLMRTVRPLRPFLDEAVENMRAKVAGKPEPHAACPLWIVNARTGEQGLGAMRRFAQMVPHGVAALDSIDAAQPEAVLSGDIGTLKVGNLAKLMSDAMRKLVADAEDNKVALVFVNQIRQKITMFGDPNDTPGGLAMKYYASQRIQLKKPNKDDVIKDGDGDQVGVVIRYKIVKNKMAPDGNEGEFHILLKNGIFRERELVSRCLNLGVLKFGGRGGKQVLLPTIDIGTGELEVDDSGEQVTIAMRQFDAARRLILDQRLLLKLASLYDATLNPGHHAVDNFLDEISDPE
jgi:recombination protein RecA